VAERQARVMTERETPKPKPRRKLRSVEDLSDAIEDLYNDQETSKIDAKTADAMNTTLKSAVYLRVQLPMNAYKLFVTAAIKKITVPKSLLDVLPIPLTD